MPKSIKLNVRRGGEERTTREVVALKISLNKIY